MTTIATLCSGGEGVGVGGRAVGLTHLWGIECVDGVANVARANGFNVITADVTTIDPSTLPIPDVLHISPSCKRASNANQRAELNEDGTKEAPEDVAMGEKAAQFIDTMTPRIFTLENVYAYRNFKAFKIICAALSGNGYMWDFDNLNAADFGVPQERRRLILRAVRGALLPMLPQPERWVGWGEAIEDLIPALPNSQLAPWQLAALPERARRLLTGGNETESFIVDSLNYHRDGTRNSTTRYENEPVFSIPVYSTKHPAPRAFVVGNQYGRFNNVDKRHVQIRFAHEPFFSLTVSDANHKDVRAWLTCGRVVQMTVAAMARFQSFPDDYKGINEIIIGNAVPPLLYQKIISAFVV